MSECKCGCGKDKETDKKVEKGEDLAEKMSEVIEADTVEGE